MRRANFVILGTALLMASAIASAGTVSNNLGTVTSGGIACSQALAGVCSAVSGVHTVTFDGSASQTPLGTLFLPGVLYSGNFSVQAGDLANKFRSPGGDSTKFISTPGASSTTALGNVTAIDLNELITPDNYFGFYLGSIDSYNAITFSGLNWTETFNGCDLALLAGTTCDGSPNANAYFNFFFKQPFTTITLTSTNFAMESDNHSFGYVAAPVPEPSSLALLGTGLLSFGAFVRKRFAA